MVLGTWSSFKRLLWSDMDVCFSLTAWILNASLRASIFIKVSLLFVLIVLAFCRCDQLCPFTLQVPAWSQRLLREVSSHRQPEVVQDQSIPQHLWGCEECPEPKDKPYYPICSEQGWFDRCKPPWGQAPAPLLQPAGWPQTGAPDKLTCTPLCPPLGGGSSLRGPGPIPGHAQMSLCETAGTERPGRWRRPVPPRGWPVANGHEWCTSGSAAGRQASWDSTTQASGP